MSLFIILLVQGLTFVTCTQSPLLVLVSSSIFTLELRPTDYPLVKQSIDSIEESLSSTITFQDSIYIELEVVVRRSLFVPGTALDHPMTTINFVLLATVLARDMDKDHRNDLNTLITNSMYNLCDEI